MKAEVFALANTYTELLDGFGVTSLLGVPSVLFRGLTQLVCFVRRAANTIPQVIDDFVVQPVHWLLDELAVGNWGSPVAPDCYASHCLDVAERSTDVYRDLTFPLKHLMFWDHTGPPLIDFCGGTMEWKFTVPGLFSKYSLQSTTLLQQWQARGRCSFRRPA